MPTLTITTRRTASGPRYVVRYRLGGRSYPVVSAGSFKTLKEAKARRDLVGGLLAAAQNPTEVLRQLREQPQRRALAEWAERYRASRVDYADQTAKNLGSHLKAILPTFGAMAPETVTPADVQEWIANSELKPSSLRKYLNTFRLLLDFAQVEPNPARDRRVKLPRATREEPQPPTAEHVEAAVGVLPKRYRLPALVLDATGMRVGELEHLTWGDVDEARRRWRVSAAITKTGRARWVQVPESLFETVCALVPREDRAPERPVFLAFGADRFRTALSRACVAAGVPTFSPHDLRHRRISLLHGQGVSWARIGEFVGQRDIAVTANTYTHVLVDEGEVEHSVLLQ